MNKFTNLTRAEFMDIVARRIDPLPYDEKKEALSYYNEIFDDAGIENEKEVVKSLGDPIEIAESIITSSGYMISSGKISSQNTFFEEEKTAEKVEVEEEKFQRVESETVENSAAEEKFERVNYTRNERVNPIKSPKNKGKRSPEANLVLVIILVLTFPIWLSVLATYFGVVITLFVATVAVLAVFIILPIALLVTTIMVIPSNLVVGIILIGLTIMFFGIANLLCIFAKYIFKFGAAAITAPVTLLRKSGILS